jgi:lysyl-tRNA synthetase class 2
LKLFDALDLGDIIGCEGTLFVTRTGERTLRVGSFELLTKALHPLPDKHSGLTDKETRYRRRYADLIVNPEVREVFRRRSQIIQAVRNFLNREGFLEVGRSKRTISDSIYRCTCASPTSSISRD